MHFRRSNFNTSESKITSKSYMHISCRFSICIRNYANRNKTFDLQVFSDVTNESQVELNQNPRAKLFSYQLLVTASERVGGSRGTSKAEPPSVPQPGGPITAVFNKLNTFYLEENLTIGWYTLTSPSPRSSTPSSSTLFFSLSREINFLNYHTCQLAGWILIM